MNKIKTGVTKEIDKTQGLAQTFQSKFQNIQQSNSGKLVEKFKSQVNSQQ